MTKKIAQVVVGLPVDGPFDYKVGENLQDHIEVGKRVSVSFNHRKRVGYVVGLKEHSNFKRLNPVLDLLDNEPAVDAAALELSKQFNAYYGCSLGEAIEAYLPKVLRQNKEHEIVSHTLEHVKDVNKKAETILLHDKSKHKRWPVILQYIKEAIANKQNVIFLVPENSYFNEIEAKLKSSLECDITRLAKRLTAKKELALWNQLKSSQGQIIIGTRSAIFVPAMHLGLIVIYDEEKEAYKQEQTPHYHVHEVAQMRSKIDQCKVMYVSSVPTPELMFYAKKKEWKMFTFNADTSAPIQLIDMNNYNPRKTSILSFPLQNAITKTLGQDGKVLIYMNRKGFSTKTGCQQCGHVLTCERCNVNLNYSNVNDILTCPHCTFKMKLPKVCPQCRGSYMRSMGTGIERLATEAARLYPTAKVSRYDKDSKSFPKGADIVIATQAIFNVGEKLKADLVAVVNIDSELNRFDFRSSYKAFSLLFHLNQMTRYKLLIQTRVPDDYCLKAARNMNFAAFYRQELKLREELELPPYKHMIAVGLRSEDEQMGLKQSQGLYDLFLKDQDGQFDISNPHPDVLPKLRDKYRYTITLKSKSVKDALFHVKNVLKKFRKKKNTVITVNVDP